MALIKHGLKPIRTCVTVSWNFIFIKYTFIYFNDYKVIEWKPFEKLNYTIQLFKKVPKSAEFFKAG